ncbi:MAG: Flp family type IVb pilin [Chloroflexi bacterium]|jgi:Flp pilus assembly pilin Flp|nr:Flp family type IVb pilin [Chloroflexota bacterium]
MKQKIQQKALAKTLVVKEKGQGLAEVAIILALVVIVSIAAVRLLGINIDAALTTVANAI